MDNTKTWAVSLFIGISFYLGFGYSLLLSITNTDALISLIFGSAIGFGIIWGLEYLKENNLEIEFGKLHFIKKGKTTEELEKFTNPKRDYLKNLLEMDSQHSRKSSEIQDR